MILLKSLKTNNFLSYKEAEIDFPENIQVDISGQSGSGKSALIDAIIWCLFGKGRSDNRNLIHSGAKKAIVVLELINTETSYLYRIERSILSTGKQNLAVFWDMKDEKNIPIQKTGLKDYQDWIEREFLHSSYTLFINSIAYPQENTESFVKQTASKRKDLLLEIAHANDYDIYYSRAKDKMQLLNEGLIRIKTNIENHEGIIKENQPLIEGEDLLRNKIKDLKENIAIQKEKKVALLERISQQKNLITEKNMLLVLIAEHEKNIKNCQDWIIARETKIDAFNVINIEEVNAKVQKLAQIRMDLKKYENIYRHNAIRSANIFNTQLAMPPQIDYDSGLTDLNKQLIAVLTQQDCVCPDGKHCTCYLNTFKGRKEELEHMITETMAKRAKQNEGIKDLNRWIAEEGPELGDGQTMAHVDECRKIIETLLPYEQIKNDVASKNNIIVGLKEEIVGVQKDINAFKLKILETKEEIIKKDEAIKAINVLGDISEIDNLLSTLESAKSQHDRALTLLEMAKQNIVYSRHILITLKEEQLKNLEESECLGYIKEAFGSKGIKTIVIDYLIPRLENSINDILGQLSDFRIKLDTQHKAVDGESVVEGLFISIFNENGEEFDFTNYSGGQKLKISVAISEALASIQHVGFRIFDEIFLGLDESSTDSFSAVMQSLQTRFPQILCISHLRQIQDRFVTKLLVTKNGKESVVELT